MLRYALPTALAAALWFGALAPSSAQDKPDPKKPTGAAQTAPANPAITAKPVVPVPPPRPSDPNVVGSVNGKNIMFMDVVEHLRRDSPDAFKAAVAQVAGAKVAEQLYGATPQPSVTITTEEVMTALRDKPNQAIFTTFQRMLQSEAITQAAAKENITVTDQQVDSYISTLFANLRKQGRIAPGVTDDQFLAQQKISRATLVEEFRPQVALAQLKEKDPDLQKQLKKNVEQTIGHPLTPDDFLQARHILILSGNPQSANPADVKSADAAALAKINKIAADLKANKKTFEAAAKESSEDPGSKPQGGELGVFTRGSMVPEFDKAAFSAKPGVIIGPIKSQYGYHLIQVEKLGKDMTPEQRKVALTALYQRAEQQNPQITQTFMQNLMQKRVQIATYMTPPTQPTPGFPGAQGG
jgi:parvulin-like peptidyl-prolyl isomerase